MSNESLSKKFEICRERPFNHVNEETDTQWDFVVSENLLTLRFDESRSSLDWRQNFNLLKKPYRGMKTSFRVHSGFLKKYKSIREEIHSILNTFDVDKIEILGHSQGGALALLAHEDIGYNFPKFGTPNMVTVVFGCPRVFGWFAPKDRWHNVIRIQNSNDAVTKIPFTWLGFKHVGIPINIGDKRKWYSLKVKDHLPKNYRESFE